MRLIILIAFLCATQTTAQEQPPGAPAPSPLPASAPAPSQEVSVIERNGTCSFVYTSPRYYRVTAEVTLQGVRTNEVLLNDAFIRLLRSELGVAPCQLSMTQGSNCTSGTQQLPCSDPVFNCGNGTMISEDVYIAVRQGNCENLTANNTLVCNTIAANPSISQAVVSGLCRPACISGTPQATQELPVACNSYTLSVDAADKAAALAIASALGNTTVQSTLSNSLSQFSEGPGLQFLVVDTKIESEVGYGFFPPPPPPLKVIEPAETASKNTTATAMGAAGTLVYGPWSPCLPACGDGFSTRTVSCFAPDGTLLSILSCPNGASAQTYQSCSNDCPDAYFEYTPWSPCNATCGGGISLRQANCISTNGAECTDQADPTTMVCNTAPCESFTWATGAWTTCSEACGGGTKTRSVKCVVDSTGVEATSEEQCLGKRPLSEDRCNITPCDFCGGGNPCLGRGVCDGGKCTCKTDYTGSYCETPVACTGGVVDALLACCDSGLVNVRGECCSMGGTVLDGDGECCSESLDACGVCGGLGQFLDMEGSCCAVADANGVCCPSGLVDECGVCNGVGNSCAIELATEVQVPSSLIQGGAVLDDPLTQYFQDSIGSMGFPPESVTVTGVSTGPPVARRRRRRSLLQGDSSSTTAATTTAPSPAPPDSLWVTVSVTPTTNATGTTPFSSSYVAAALPTAAAAAATSPDAGIQLLNTPQPSRTGICGNGICEIGERSTVEAIDGTCPQDCGTPAVVCSSECSSTGGTCLPSTGLCQCFTGYQGLTCSDCASGFMKTGSSVCVTSVTALGLVNSTVVGPNGEALVSGMPSDGTSVGIIVGAVVGSVLCLALLVLACCFLRRFLKRKYAAEAAPTKVYNNKLAGTHYSYSNDNGAGGGGGGALPPSQFDEEIGLRQRYGDASPRPHQSYSSGDGGGGGGRLAYNLHVDVTASGNNSAQVSSRDDHHHHHQNEADGGLWQSAQSTGRDYIPAPHATNTTNNNNNNAAAVFSVAAAFNEGAAAFPSQLYAKKSVPYHHNKSVFSADEVMQRLSTYSMPGYAEIVAGDADDDVLISPLYHQQQQQHEIKQHRDDAEVGDAPHESTNCVAQSASSSIRRPQSAALSVGASSSSLSAISSGPPLVAVDPGTSENNGGGGGIAESRLFFNPAFSVDEKPRRLAQASDAPPGYVKQQQNTTTTTAVAALGSSRSASARNIGNTSRETTEERRAKLDALRAAVTALEREAAQRGGGGGPGPQQQQQQQEARVFLPGRPKVPYLALSTLKTPPKPRQRQQQQQRPPGFAAPLGQTNNNNNNNNVGSTELIGSHPGVATTVPHQQQQHQKVQMGVVAAEGKQQRSSPGAAFARGAKTMFKTMKRGGPGIPQGAAADYGEVLAKVEEALQRSAGNSPVKKISSARGGTSPVKKKITSARGTGAAAQTLPAVHAWR